MKLKSALLIALFAGVGVAAQAQTVQPDQYDPNRSAGATSQSDSTSGAQSNTNNANTFPGSNETTGQSTSQQQGTDSTAQPFGGASPQAPVRDANVGAQSNLNTDANARNANTRMGPHVPGQYAEEGRRPGTLPNYPANMIGDTLDAHSAR